MKDAIGPTNGRPIIGLSWRSTNAETGGSRSLELSEIIAGVQKRAPSAILVNLQYGYVQPEISRAFDETGVLVRQIPGLDVTSDLDGLAALIKSCDHVISIGNTTAHLAGALGTKTQVMLPFAASWRWMASGTQTPWYESLKLHRRGSHLGSWSSVIDDATRSAVECIDTRS
jgi:hypothetical protein